MRVPHVALAAALLMAGCSGEAPPADAAAPEAAAAQLQLENLRRTVTIMHDKFRDLADAMPEDDYAWAPMDGVRSVGDVFLHVAADNWFVPALMGVEPPAGTGVTSDVETFRAYQARDLPKDEIVAATDASFVFLLEAMDATADELDRAVTLGQSETTVGDVWIRAVVHLHEHLGQSIAYARSNDVVPPWSRP